MIDKRWNFKEAVANIRAVKESYKGLLSSFSIYEIKQERMMIQDTRNQIYELKIFEWQKDKLWEYMNDDETILTLVSIANRQK